MMSGATIMQREYMTDKDWDAKFELLLSEDLIDLPKDLKEEKIFFSQPSELDEIF